MGSKNGGIHRLTALAITRKMKAGYHCDGGGLYLQVSSGGKSWVFRYRSRTTGKLRDMGLGPLGSLCLADARESASQCRKQLLVGTDPIEARRASTLKAKLRPASKTFKECAEAYISAYCASWRNPKHADQWRNTLRQYAYPKLGSLPVTEINVRLVMSVLDPIWSTKHETARRVRGRMERVLGWAIAHEYRVGPNPAQWNGLIDKLVPSTKKVAKVKHHNALPYKDIPDFMSSLRTQNGVAAAALEFAILTAARTKEVIGATWSEVSLDKRVWTVPGDRMKAGREHNVPLSSEAISLLRRMEHLRNGNAVFPAQAQGKHLSNMALLSVLKRMKRNDLTAHGFRSTFRDWVAEHTDAPNEVAEMALAHSVGNAVEAAYRRGDLFEKRRTLMAQWAEYCEIVPNTNVTDFKRKDNSPAL